MRRRLDEAIAPVGGPESEDLRVIEIGDADAETFTDAVGEGFDLLEGRDHTAQPPSSRRSPARFGIG